MQFLRIRTFVLYFCYYYFLIRNRFCAVIQAELLPVSKRTSGSHEVKVNMRSFTPKLTDNSWNFSDTSASKNRNKRNSVNGSSTKPTIQSYHVKKITPGYSMNDLDRIYPEGKLANLSIESLKTVLKNSDVSYMDNGEICKHDIGGSVPDLKKIFITEFI